MFSLKHFSVAMIGKLKHDKVALPGPNCLLSLLP